MKYNNDQDDNILAKAYLNKVWSKKVKESADVLGGQAADTNLTRGPNTNIPKHAPKFKIDSQNDIKINDHVSIHDNPKAIGIVRKIKNSEAYVWILKNKYIPKPYLIIVPIQSLDKI